jgi:hypothetical protein
MKEFNCLGTFAKVSGFLDKASERTKAAAFGLFFCPDSQKAFSFSTNTT